MKIIEGFSNQQDNIHCLQACVKSILLFYFPKHTYSDEEIDNMTGHFGGWSWLPHTVNWLHDLGLSVELHSLFDYKTFANEGLSFMQTVRSPEIFNNEKENGAYNHIHEIQEASQKMVDNGLWKNNWISPKELASLLKDEHTMVIGKTFHEWLRNSQGNTAHYVVVLKEYSPNIWEVHDPGLPFKKYRKVSSMFQGNSILLDTLIVKGFIQKNSE